MHWPVMPSGPAAPVWWMPWCRIQDAGAQPLCSSHLYTIYPLTKETATYHTVSFWQTVIPWNLVGMLSLHIQLILQGRDRQPHEAWVPTVAPMRGTQSVRESFYCCYYYYYYYHY